jgi:hypothetical protein
MTTKEKMGTEAMSETVKANEPNVPWMRLRTTVSEKSLRIRKLVIASLVPLMLVGGLVAAMAVPTTSPNVIVLSLYIEPLDGSVSGVHGPHRFFPCTVKPVPEGQKPGPAEPSQNEVSSLKALEAKLAGCYPRDCVVLMVSAVATLEHGKILLLQTDGQASQKLFLEDLVCTINQAPAFRRMVVLDIQWPTTHAASSSEQSPKEMYDAIVNVIQSQADTLSRYVLTSGPESWARGMQNPRESAFLHFWNQATHSSATDLNGNGRMCIDEILQRTRQLLCDWSQTTFGCPQKPKSLGFDLNFDIAFVKSDADSRVQDEVAYPEALKIAWQRRDDYLQRTDIPVDIPLVEVWQKKLLNIESRWRRAINDDATATEIESVNAWANAMLQQQLKQMSDLRPDSLWMAAKTSRESPVVEVTDPTTKTITTVTFDRWVDVYLGEADAIKGSPSDAATQAAIEKLTSAGLAGIPVEKQLGLLDCLIGRVCEQPSASALRMQAAAIFCKVSNLKALYAETDFLQQRVGVAMNETQWDDAILRLIRIRGKLGDRPRLFAVMQQRLESFLDDCLTAENFYWFDGFTTDEHVSQQILAGSSRVEIGLSHQRCIELAVSVLENAIVLLRCEGRPIVGDDLRIRILEDAERLSDRLWVEAVKTEAESTLAEKTNGNPSIAYDPIANPAMRFEAIRYATERLTTSMASWLASIVDSDIAPGMDPMIAVLPAERRIELYNRLIQGYVDPAPLSLRSTAGVKPKGTEANPNLDSYAERVFQIQKRSEEAEAVGLKNMGVWFHRLTHTKSIDHDPDGFYQALANRAQLRSGASPAAEIAASWEPEPIGWSQRNASLNLKNLLSGVERTEGVFSVLPPSSESLSIQPSTGTLDPQQLSSLRFRLNVQSSEEKAKPMNGVWLSWLRDGRTTYIPVSFPSIASCLPVELSMGPNVQPNGDALHWKIWPKQASQTFDWYLTNHQDEPRTVVVDVQYATEQVLSSAPMTLVPTARTPVRLLPAKPVDAQKDTSSSSSRTVSVSIVDAKTKETLVTHELEIDLVDIRRCIDVQTAEFGVMNDGGANRLTVTVVGTPASDPTGHDVRIGLSPETLPGFVSIGAGTTTARITADGGSQSIRLHDVAIDLGLSRVCRVPLIIDGDADAVWLDAIAPYSGGPADWIRNETPRALVSCPEAIIPGDPLAVSVVGVNLPVAKGATDQAALIIELGQYFDGTFVTHARRLLMDDRREVIALAPGGKDATISVRAARESWNVSIPTESIAGVYVLRVRSGVGAFEAIEKRVLMDDQSPQSVSAAAFAVDPTRVTLSILSGPSGVRSVDWIGADKSINPTVPVEADGEWVAQLKTPVKVLGVRVTTGAGKAVDYDLPIKIVPAVTSGMIQGTVYEGTIPQPHMPVQITDSKGQRTQIQTDAQGRFEVSLPIGSATLSVYKKSSQRQATVRVEISAGTPGTTDLHLARVPSRA